MKFDFEKETPTGEFPVYAAGTYLVAVDDWEYIEKNNKEFVMWKLKFEGGEFDGKELRRFDTLIEKALWTLGKWINACGIDATGLPPMETKSKDFDAVLSMCCTRKVYVYISIDETRNRNNVDDMQPYPEQTRLELTPENVGTVDPACPIK